MKMVRLEDVVDILDNLRVPINSTERLKRLGSVPYYGATGQVGTIDGALFNEPLILLGEDGVPFFDDNKHKAYLIEGPAWVNNHAHVLRPKKEFIEINFLLHFLNQFNYFGYVNGATRLKLTQSDMKRIPIPLPPLPEQKAIVEKLDAVFAEIDKLEELCIRNLNAVSELHRAYIHGLLSRIDVTPKYLNQISENFDSKRRPITKSSRNAGEYPYYGASGIVDYVEEYIFDGEYLLISEDGANLLARSTPIAFPAHGKFWVNNHAHIIQCSTLMDQTFLEFFFNSTDVSAFVTGAAQPKLSQASLHKIPIPFPDTASERAQIVSRIESSSTEIETLLSNLKSQRKMYSELRSSFLSSAFTEESDAA
jgi:type I restriction enzyme S subunit